MWTVRPTHSEMETFVGQRKYSSVVFDFGGVLITPITNRIAELAVRHGVSMETLLSVLMGPRERSTADHPWHRAERGEIPVANFHVLVEPWAREVDLVLDGDEFEIILDGVFDVHGEIIERIRALRSEGYTTGLLTNSFREFRVHLERRIDISVFDHVIDSSEVGCRKPEPEIYDLTTDRFGVAPDRILYLDDFLSNVEGAQAKGWGTIHVTSPAQTLIDLDRELERAPGADLP